MSGFSPLDGEIEYNPGVLGMSTTWIRTVAGVRPVRWLLGVLELGGYLVVAGMFWLRPDWLITLAISGFIIWWAGRLVQDRRRRRRA